MQLVFRNLQATDSPSSGELFIQASVEGKPCDDLAIRALEQGPAAFPQGAGPIQTLVVTAGPTLDDMLAALIVEERLANHPLPEGIQPFARYANLRRTGLTPSSVPLEVSLEGIYLAILNAGDGDLTKPATAAQFSVAWRRMANVIFEAAAAKADPFTTELFSQGGDFARERSFLKQDRAKFQTDVLGGQQWVVDLPGAPHGGRALLLRQPKSYLFAPWSREKDASGAGQPFLLLAVDWGNGQWVFSTDPAQQRPIGSLADVLQKAEVEANPQAAAGQPWVKRFDDSLVANRQTQLSNEKVESLVKRWARARKPPKPIPVNWAIGLAAAAIVLVMVGLHFLTPPPPKPVFRSEGDPVINPPAPSSISPEEKAELTGPGKNYALIFATDYYQPDSDSKQWKALAGPQHDAGAIGKILETKYGFEVHRFPDFGDGQGDKPVVGNTKAEIEKDIHDFLHNTKFGLQSELLVYFAGHGYYDPDLHKGYVVASDSLLSHAGSERNATCISLDDLASTLDKVPCRHVMLMLDTCFGGTVLARYAQPGPTRGDDSVDELLGPKSRIVLASVGQQEALDASPFAKAVIDSLNNANNENNGLVNAFTLYTNAARQGQAQKQPPAFGGLPGQEVGGEFLFYKPGN